MTLEKFIRYTRWTGLFRKTKTKESSYDIMEWYQLRWYHPLCWLLLIVTFLYNVLYLVKAMAKEAFEEVEIHINKE